MNLQLFIIGLVVGWVLSVMAYLDAMELLGDLRQNFKIHFLPRNHNLLIYIIGALLCGFLTSLMLNNIVFAVIVTYVVSLVLLYVAMVDLYSFQIPIYPVLIAIFIALIFNLYIVLSAGIGAGYLMPSLNIVFWASSNLLAGLIAAIVFLVIIAVTKGKGMGSGDLFVFVAMGLVLGAPKLIVSFYIMVISGCIFGLILALIHKRFKGLKMPFVPFMFLGFLVALIFGERLVSQYITLIGL
jgi:prepilin signal peptidase PulO-like enzyme (type II secretory pathway)